ncbi:MAG TPA: hypothetical protein VK823_01565 [Streptosporangiaceae bacterium]|nr:hypothetical protein [Streptosporangiaceae bacterium]
MTVRDSTTIPDPGALVTAMAQADDFARQLALQTGRRALSA